MPRFVDNIGVGQQDELGVIHRGNSLGQSPQLAAPPRWSGGAGYHRQAGVLQIPGNLAGAVGAGIVHQDDPEQARTDLAQQRGHGAGNQGRLVARGHYDRDGRWFRRIVRYQHRAGLPESPVRTQQIDPHGQRQRGEQRHARSMPLARNQTTAS